MGLLEHSKKGLSSPELFSIMYTATTKFSVKSYISGILELCFYLKMLEKPPIPFFSVFFNKIIVNSFYEVETEGSHLGERSILVLFTY